MLTFKIHPLVYLYFKNNAYSNNISRYLIKAYYYGYSSLFDINYVKSSIAYNSKKAKTLEIKNELKQTFKDRDLESLHNVLLKYDYNDFKSINSEIIYIIMFELSDLLDINLIIKILIASFKKFDNSKNLIKVFFKEKKTNEEVLFFLSSVNNDQLSEELKSEIILYTYNKFITLSCKKASNDELYTFNQIFIEKYKDILNETNIKIIYKNFSKMLIKFITSKDLENFKNLLLNIKYVRENISDIFFNKLLDLISKVSIENKIDFLNEIIDCMKLNEIKFSCISLNSIMDLYSIQGNVEKCIDIFFNKFKENNIEPDNYSYSIIIKSLKNNDKFDYLMAVNFFNAYKNSNLKQDVIIYNSILDLLINKNKIEEAEKLFEEMLENKEFLLDNISFNIMIKSCYKFYKNDINKPLYYKNKLIERNLEPNIITLNTLMDILIKNNKFDMIFDVLEEMKRFKINPDKYTYSTILNGLKNKKSDINYIKNILNKLKFYIKNLKFNIDEVLFNSILDICIFHKLNEDFNYFNDLMDTLNIKKTSITYGILIKGFSCFNEFEKSYEIYELIKNNKDQINDKLIGSIIGAYIKNGDTDKALEIYDGLSKPELKNNSSIFTQIIKGLYNKNKLYEAIEFFNEIKEKITIKGILITYNCMLDILIKVKKYNQAHDLFEEIKEKFTPDIFSYSSIIKKYINNNEKVKILDMLKIMKDKNINIDNGMVNIVLDSCSNKVDYNIGFEIFKFINTINFKPNEITFGIMIKISGFAKKVSYGFDMYDSLKYYGIEPSIVIYTNLIHISFGNRDFKSVEKAFELFRKSNLKGDNLMFEKLVNGFVRFNKIKEAKKYVNICSEYSCTLKDETMDKINNFSSNIKIFQNNKFHNNNNRHQKGYNKYNQNNRNYVKY